MNEDLTEMVQVPRALLWICFDLLSSAVTDDCDAEATEEWMLAIAQLRSHLGSYIIQ